MYPVLGDNNKEPRLNLHTVRSCNNNINVLTTPKKSGSLQTFTNYDKLIDHSPTMMYVCHR